MKALHDRRFPGENKSYRKARNALLREEMELRRHVERVAAMRRELPSGGKIEEDYVFEEAGLDSTRSGKVRMSALFGKDKDCLLVYSFMYGPNADKPCPMCTSMLDSLDGTSPHAQQRINLVVVARSPADRIRDWARSRGWRNLRLLSSAENTYNADYGAEDEKGAQWPALNVFQKTAEGIHHSYNTELLYVPEEKGQDGRHVDMIWPLWNLFDYTPAGRGTDWRPKLRY